MKTKKEQIEIVGKLLEQDTIDLELVISILTKISKEKRITEDNINDMDNILSTLIIFQRDMYRRYIKLLKQNHMLD